MSESEEDVLGDEDLLERKMKRMMAGDIQIDSDPDNDIVRRKIKERLEGKSPSSQERRSQRDNPSNADLFESDDDSRALVDSRARVDSRALVDSRARVDSRALVRRKSRSSSSSSSGSDSSSSDSSTSDSSRSGRRRSSRKKKVAVRKEGGRGDEAAEQIYKELHEIHQKLQVESAALRMKEADLLRREEELCRRENLLRQSEEMYSDILETEKRRTLEEVETSYQRDMDELNELFREKCRENKRLRENFDAIKSTNDTLKSQLEMLTGRHEKLERQSSSLQGRLTNLQRVHANTENKAITPLITKPERDTPDVKPKPKPRAPASMCEVVSVLLEWLAENQLKNVTRVAVSGNKDEDEQSMERATKILPHLADLLREGVPQGGRMDLPCLQFTYWTLYKIDQSQGMHRTSLSSTFRRLGEELYRSKSVSFHEPKSDGISERRDPLSVERREGRFYRSDDLQERFLSSLIVLKTLSQADIVAHVFDTVKADLKEAPCKDMFIHYKAISVFLPFFKPANQTLLSGTCDLLLLLCMEGRVLEQFLLACSTEIWFRQCAVILKSPQVDKKVVEKLSVVLQKLSKMKSNRRHLETFGITSCVQDLLRECRDENAFLALNLKSIQYNLLQKV